MTREYGSSCVHMCACQLQNLHFLTGIHHGQKKKNKISKKQSRAVTKPSQFVYAKSLQVSLQQ